MTDTILHGSYDGTNFRPNKWFNIDPEQWLSFILGVLIIVGIWSWAIFGR